MRFDCGALTGTAMASSLSKEALLAELSRREAEEKAETQRKKDEDERQRHTVCFLCRAVACRTVSLRFCFSPLSVVRVAGGVLGTLAGGLRAKGAKQQDARTAPR